MRSLLSFLFPLCLFVLLGCQGDRAEDQNTRQDLVREKTEELLLPKLEDPDSYAFESLELVDSSATGYTYLLTFRGNVAPGAEGLNRRRVLVGPPPKYDILDISEIE